MPRHWLSTTTGTILLSFVLSSCSPKSILGFRFFQRPSIRAMSSRSAKSMVKRSKTTGTVDEERQPHSKMTINTNSLLFRWATHSDASFHSLDDRSATEIRHALLTWYRAHRRKLPWRGDKPPFDGSTAGVNRGASDNKRADSHKQPSIRKFFGTTTTVGKEEDKAIENVESSGEAIPVTAYGVWVSEIMLQQTRVEAVIPYYLKWMKSFPTVYDLANATEEQVNAHWAGLGFYRRARLLHKGAKRVVDDYNGVLPRTVEELQNLEGIGRYTASAVASIAYDVCVPVVDGNVCRVLSRLTGIANHIKAPVLKDDLGWDLAEQIVQAGDGSDAGEVNQALMELGATYCAPSGATGMDDRDPLKPFYMSTQLGFAFSEEPKKSGDKPNGGLSVSDYLEEIAAAQEATGSRCKLCGDDGVEVALNELFNVFNWAASEKSQTDFCPGQAGHSVFPLSPPKGEKREEVLAVVVASHSCASDQTQRWLLVKRPAKGLLAGQWEFPSVCVWNSADLPPQTNKKRKSGKIEVPTIKDAIRREALNEFLDELLTGSDENKLHHHLRQSGRSSVQDLPLEHIFSHVRHTMWLEYCELTGLDGSISDASEWTAANGRQVRWMSESDMKTVGITSGVKKVLKAVKAKTKKSSKKPKR